VAPSVKADAGVNIGQIFQGKYRVEAILGHGGMGVVAECTHLALNERVAIKMLRQDVLLDQDAVYRFLREAQAAVKLKSEYVARVSDVGTFENGVPYMVMEFLEGHDLGELLKQRGVLPVQWAVELMLQTAEALAEAHSLNIVHRDVKPTNLFVTWRPDGTALIKVLDFGISKSPLGTDMQLTQTQSLLGTPAYMSPEQMRSARLVDTRTDIWSLGTVFYEILEGRRPFEAESFSEMCVKVAVDPPAPMVNTPPGLQQVIMKCLAKSPEQRYASMAELGRDLVPYSNDPHGAQMLVERMGRMLRRAAHDWEGSGGTGVRGARELGSGPVPRAQTPAPQQWGIGSDPAASPWNAKSEPSRPGWHGPTPRGDGSQPFARPIGDGSQPFSRNDASQPFARPMSDDSSAGYAGSTVSVKKSRLPLVLIMGAGIAAAAIGLGFYYANQDPAPVTQAHESETVQLQTTPPAVVAPVEEPTKPPTADTETKPDVITDVKPEDVKVEPKKVDIKKVGKTGTGKTGKKTDPKTVKAGAGSATIVPATEPKKEPDKPPAKPCNPFESMHGCPSK
jgi:eukaryotic-like serine/threonine-protein kinase